MGQLVILSGDDEFTVKERARAVARELAGGEIEENPAVEIIAGDGEELKPDEVIARFLDALRTPPFLCDSKLVWLRHLRDLELFSAREPGDGVAGVLEILTQPLPPELSVLIDGGGLDQRKSFCKTVKSAGATVEIFNAVKATDRRFADGRKESLREICGSLGKSLEPAAAQFLTETIGGDSGMLRNELEKLCSYVGDAAVITLADCREVCSRTPETVSWEFTGAIVGRDRPRALRLLDIMLRRGEPEIRLMYALSGEFQKLIQTRLAMKQLKLTRVTPRTFDSLPESLKKEFPDNPLLKLHPFRAFKTCEGAAGFTDAELAGNLEAVRNASRALVSGGGEPRIILEQLVLRLTARR